MPWHNETINTYQMKKTAVFIIDDYQLIREAWASLFVQDEKYEVIGHSGDGEEAVEKVKELRPDLVLLDINMTPLNGFDILKLIRKYSPATRVIAVSMHLQPNYARRMLKSGAKGYVSKGSNTREFLKAADEVMQGNTYISEDIKEILSKQWTDEDHLTGIDALSERELEIIREIRNGLSSKLIAEKLHIGAKTVEVHRHNILKKLNVKNTAALIELINHYGL